MSTPCYFASPLVRVISSPPPLTSLQWADRVPLHCKYVDDLNYNASTRVSGNLLVESLAAQLTYVRAVIIVDKYL